MIASAARVAVVHYSATGNVYRLAVALAEAAADGGAEVGLRRVAELAPPEAIDNTPRWPHHVDEVAPDVALAEVADLEWADGIALGSPTRFGLPSAQLKQFLDQTGGLWAAGVLANKVVTVKRAAQRHERRAVRKVRRVTRRNERKRAAKLAEKARTEGVNAGYGSGYGAGNSAGHAAGKEEGYEQGEADGASEAFSYCYYDDGTVC